jgi:Mannosyltransferase (PIG-V)
MRVRSPFRQVVAIRVAYWLAIAVTLLWAPLHTLSPFRAYTALGDLLFDAFARWDAVWFVHIADHGYDSKQVTAFFPLYPLVVHAVSEVTRSTVVAGVLVSLAAAGAAGVLVHAIARTQLERRAADDTVLLLALYPLAFVFTAVYSDALFLALSAGSFLAGLRGRSVAAGVLGGLAVATRLIGLALLPALLVLLWPRARRDVGRLVPLLLLPAALGAYALYLRSKVGDGFAFLHAQGEYWHRHTPTLGPLRGLWDATSSAYHGAAELLLHLPRGGGGFRTPDAWAMWNVLQFLLLVAAIWLTVLAWRRFGPAFGLYSAATIAIYLSSPAQFVPLVSEPRFLLSDFPLFVVLGSLVADRPRARQWLACAFAAAGGIAALAFSRGSWVA